jgi:hypothetical protein
MVSESSMFVPSRGVAEHAEIEDLREFVRTEYPFEESGWFVGQIRKAIENAFGVHQGGRLCLHPGSECPHQ